MFVLVELKDNIRIDPELFNMKLVDAIKNEINRKLANKVLLNVGLCIMLKDIVKLGDSIILPGDGASHTEVHFRYLVFQPTVGDVVTGKIRSCSREGVHITIGFFDDILIPPSSLQHPSRYEEAEQAWVWEYPLEDGNKHDLYMDIGELIKFRVSGEVFEESSPIGPPDQDVSGSGVGGRGPVNATASGASERTADAAKTPYRITGAINESGLGLLSWWVTANQEEEDEEEADEEAEEEEEEGDQKEQGQ